MNITIEKALRTALYLTVACYLIHFVFLGFFVSPWDFDHLAGYYETAWHFWKTGTGIPQYNPFQCGGRSLGGDPQNFIFSPWTALVGLMGAMWTVKIQMLFELALGIYGLHLLFTFFKFDTLQKLAGFFFYLAGGMLVSRFVTGHVTLGFYFFYPLFFALSYRITKYRDLLSWNTFAYVLLFIYAGNHKPNFYIYGILPLATEVFFRCIFTGEFAALGALAIASLLSAGVNAIYLLPSQRYFTDFPRHDTDEWLPIPLYTYLVNLLMPLRTIPKVFYGPRFLQRHEYNLFLGPFVLWLAAKGYKTFIEPMREHRSALFFASLLCIFIGVGSSTPAFSFTYPFTWFLKWWPGFQSVRVPTRFWILSAVFLTLLAANGIHALKSKRSRVLFYCFGVLPLLLSAVVNLSKTTLLSTETQWSAQRSEPKDHVWISNDIKATLRYLTQGKGVLNCVDNMSFEVNPLLRPGDSLAYQASAPASVNLSWQTWNKIQVNIDSKFPVSVGLNLNPHPYWHFEGRGGETPALRNSPLTIFAKDGHALGTLVFTQPMSIEGLITTLFALLILALYGGWIFLNSRRVRIIGLTGGVASGKSIVAEAFQKAGIPVFNMDLIGREILENDKKIIGSLKALCGADILKSDGSVDRVKMRVVLFADPEMKKHIEHILHPAIWHEFYRRARLERKAGKKTVICEAALHIESKLLHRLDGLIVVLADEKQRIERLMERDQISKELAEKMLLSQTTDEERKRLATVTIENTGTREELFNKSVELIQEFKSNGFI